jgi:hypothetical protein
MYLGTLQISCKVARRCCSDRYWCEIESLAGFLAEHWCDVAERVRPAADADVPGLVRPQDSLADATQRAEESGRARGGRPQSIVI